MRDGKVVIRRAHNPKTSVQIWVPPPIYRSVVIISNIGSYIAQLEYLDSLLGDVSEILTGPASYAVVAKWFNALDCRSSYFVGSSPIYRARL